MKKEVIVIGCGPAGLSAAIYLGRANIDTLVLGKQKDSQVMKAHLIMNYLGFPKGITGEQLLKNAMDQVRVYNVPILENEVINVEQDKESFILETEDGKVYESKALIIATGTPIKLSGIENEERLTSKGVHYCVECDGPLYHNKNLAVIGNGNHAAEEAILLLSYTKNITIIANADRFEISSKLRDQIKKNKIPMITKSVKSFDGETKIEGITLMDGQKMKFDGVFMGCGELSAFDFSAKLALTIENDSLIVDKNGMTSVKGIFAAGNCISKCRQVAKSVGDGCNAALSAIRYVRNKEVYQDYATSKN
ncbi:FAD-dependent oxidoreductase [Candidatus Woesearchaeota archaeon]|nr:FAD-dependent oxidoreductase [Candidatus Woesearchaeota archaeon]